jgi:hypothetical protein
MVRVWSATPGWNCCGSWPGFTGLIDGWDRALLGTYKAMPIHFPGSVLADLAVAIADGADSITDLQALGDQPAVFGPVASTPTAWGVLDRVSADHLPLLRAGRGKARAAPWAAGAAPDLDGELCLDIDATIVVAHSEKELATATWKKTFGHHPLLASWTAPRSRRTRRWPGSSGRDGPGRTPPQTTSVSSTRHSLRCPPRPARGPGGPQIVVRADAAGATFGFAAACRAQGVGFSFRFPITEDVRTAIKAVPATVWAPAAEPDDDIRDGAWGAELTGLLDLTAWPAGSRVIVRSERPHPGANQSLFDTIEGLRHTPFICAPAHPDQRLAAPIARLELRHRRHTRIEDRIPSQSRRTAPPVVQRRRREPRLARMRPRRRPRRLVETVVLRRPARPRPLRDRHLPLPHPSHRGPHHPLCPNHLPPPRQNLDLGQTTRPRLHPPPRRVRLNATPAPTTAPIRPRTTPTPDPPRPHNNQSQNDTPYTTAKALNHHQTPRPAIPHYHRETGR